MSRQQYGLSEAGIITEDVRKFLIQFKENVQRGYAKELYDSYVQFQRITDKTYQVSTWPIADDVMRTLQLSSRDESNKIFLYLYRELYFRHAFNRCDISFNYMHDSFQNYINLFNTLLDCYDNDKKFPQVPNVWLWECIQSFVSQFQYYHHWKCDPNNDYENLNLLLEYKGTNKQQSIQEKWSVNVVLRYLHYFVKEAKMPIFGNEPPDIALDDQKTNPQRKSKTLSIMMPMLGLFSLIGLSRIHTMLGDYRTAIDVMDPVDLKAKVSLTHYSYYLFYIYPCTHLYFMKIHSLPLQS